MPKELIHDNTPLPEGDGEQSTPYAIQVGWDRVGYAQIGTVNLQAEEHTPEHGWFVDLDRRMVNDLIRLLQRARDGAFGKDA